ncbi:MAG: hydrogenase, partial [Actinomycetia bacterium]|nr:hydrogenase [Actinomycetes bacterium]
MPIEIEHGCARSAEQLVPVPCRISYVSSETSDVKAYRVQSLEGKKPFDCQPGQTAMVSVIP